MANAREILETQSSVIYKDAGQFTKDLMSLMKVVLRRNDPKDYRRREKERERLYGKRYI